MITKLSYEIELKKFDGELEKLTPFESYLMLLRNKETGNVIQSVTVMEFDYKDTEFELLAYAKIMSAETITSLMTYKGEMKDGNEV